MTWPTKKLGEIISFEKGRKMAIASAGEPYIGIDGLRTNQYAVYTQEKKGVRCKPDDVLLVWDGAHAGTVGTGLSGFVGSTIVKVLHANSLENRFLFYLLKFFQEKIRAAAQGAAIPHLNKTFINVLKIPLPPLKIQQQIVERIDKIAEAQKLNDKQIELAEELFQSLLHHELDPKGKNWEVKKLGDICEINPRTNLDLKRDKIKYAEMAAVDENLKEIRYFLDRPINKVSSGAPKFKDNDVIFARITPCTENGKLAFVENCPGVCAGSTELHVLRARPNNLLPRFLFYYLIRPKIKNMAVESMIGSTGRQRVPAEFFHYLKIPVPPIETQRKIVEKLSAVQDYKKKLLEQKSKLEELFESVLNKAFKGQL